MAGRSVRCLFLTLAVIVCFSSARSQELSSASDLLDPSSITITGYFEMPRGPTPLELAVRLIEAQAERKRLAEIAATPLDPILKYLPGEAGATMNLLKKEDDPFFTPGYLKLTGRLLDRQLAVSEKRAASLFAP